MAIKTKGLGRGIDALLGPMTEEASEPISTNGASSINEIALSQIQPNPGQPRREFDEDALAELAASISSIGIIQPITLRKVDDSSYQIIAGERRFRAAKIAGLDTIPAYIKTDKDDRIMEMALIENIQREDLNSIEIALAYQSLIEKHGLKQDELSPRVGKKRATIANYLRLLKLPSEIQMGLKDKKIGMGHARALVSVEDPRVQIEIYEQILEYDYSVRKVEEIVSNVNEGGAVTSSDEQETGDTPVVQKLPIPEEYTLMRNHLSKFFNTNVKFICNENGKGKITIPFSNERDLEYIIGKFDALTN
ncbi:MAG: ParB/RepB/Spo0J family partition protein [Bacteroidales bacterium]|jgi:ParB family chromosome partitioning protein|nr:ParB/RepB/Spo0J family partition protein [Bacteroidales bacterium]